MVHAILASLIIVTYVVASLNPVSGGISTLLQYCNNTVGYSYKLYKTGTECTRAIASSLIYAVVLCESAQRYRALMVILQSHRTQNMILRCCLNVSVILRRLTKSCLLCFFYISPFQFTEFFIHLSLLFFYMLCGALLRPKNGYLRGASSARARRAPGADAEYI